MAENGQGGLAPRGRPSLPHISTPANPFPAFRAPMRQMSPHRANAEVAAAVERNDLPGVCAVLEALESAEARAACLAPFGPMKVSALQLAAEHGDAALPIVQELLRHGARADASDKLGRTPLHHAVAKAGDATIRALLAAGAQPNAQFRVLPASSISAPEDAPSIPNEANIGVNAGERLPLPECWGRTPLHLAVKGNFPEIVSQLLNAGALVDVKDERGLSPLLLAGVDIDSENIYANPALTPQAPNRGVLARYEKVVSMLLDAGASPLDRNPETGATALHHAVRARSVMAVEMLLDKGADPADTGGRGITPLHDAAAGGSLPIIKAILDKAGDSLVNVPDPHGRTPLHMAAAAGSRAAVTLLLARGADLAARTVSGASAADALRDGIPRPALFLCKLFDSCVTANSASVNDRDFKIYAAMNVLCPHGESEQMGVVRALIEATPPDLRAVLFQHPLMQAFVRLKWQGLRTFYLLLVAVHLGFLGSLSIYAVDLVTDANDWRIHSPVTENLWFVLLATTSVVLMYIFLQLWLMPWHYLREIETWLQMISALLAIAGALVPFSAEARKSRFPFDIDVEGLGKGFSAYANESINCTEVHYALSKDPQQNLSVVMRNGSICMFFCNFTGYYNEVSFCGQPHIAEYHLLALALLLGWAQFMLLAGRFPTIGYYSLMFIKVLTNVLKVLLSFWFLVIGFALSFVVLFNGLDSFDTPWESLGRTTVMMTGEFDYVNLFEQKGNNKYRIVEYTSRFVFFLFIILAPIVLMNLMVGLAVSDIQALVEEGQVRMIVKQADFVSHLEGLSTSLSRPRVSRWLFCYCCWACSKPRGHSGCNVLRHAVPLTLTLQPMFPSRGYPSLPDHLLEILAELALRNRDRDRRRRRKAMAVGGAQAAQMLSSPVMRPLGMAMSMPPEGRKHLNSSCGYSSSSSCSSDKGSSVSGRTGGGGSSGGGMGTSGVRVRLQADDTSAGEMSSPPPTSYPRRMSDRPALATDRRPSELSVTQMTIPSPSARAHADIMRMLKRLRKEVAQVRSHLLSEEDVESSNLLSASTRRGRNKQSLAHADANVLAAAASFRRRRTSQAQKPSDHPSSPPSKAQAQASPSLPSTGRNSRLSEVVTSLRESAITMSRLHHIFNARPDSTDMVELVPSSPAPSAPQSTQPRP